MKSEIIWLVLSVALAIVQVLVAAAGKYQRIGLAAMVGNQEGLPALTGWAGRAERAHRNMIENLVLFAALVIAVSVSGQTGLLTLIGAQLFFWARLAYAVLYVAGVPWLRTLAWVVSLAGMLLILATLLWWKAGPAY